MTSERTVMFHTRKLMERLGLIGEDDREGIEAAITAAVAAEREACRQIAAGTRCTWEIHDEHRVGYDLAAKDIEGKIQAQGATNGK